MYNELGFVYVQTGTHGAVVWRLHDGRVHERAEPPILADFS